MSIPSFYNFKQRQNSLEEETDVNEYISARKSELNQRLSLGENSESPNQQLNHKESIISPKWDESEGNTNYDSNDRKTPHDPLSSKKTHNNRESPPETTKNMVITEENFPDTQIKDSNSNFIASNNQKEQSQKRESPNDLKKGRKDHEQNNDITNSQNQEAGSILPSKQSSINYNQQFIKSPRRGKEVFFNTLQSDGKKQMLEEVGDPTHEFREELRMAKEKYVDQIFCPSLLSLLNNSRKTTKHEWKSFEWKRVSDIYRSGKITLIENISPLDPGLGQINNHYLLSSMSAIAENPNRIRRLFKTKAFNEEGIYTLVICKDGTWEEFIIDDFVPTTKRSTLGKYVPVFCNARGIEQLETNFIVWPVLLEKAWAKAFNGYERIEKGTINECLRDLTGAPCDTVAKDDENYWDRLSQAHKLKHILLAEPATEQEQTLLSQGLDPKFSYSIVQISDSTTTQRFVQIRNPWSGLNNLTELGKKSAEIAQMLNSTNTNDAQKDLDSTLIWLDFKDFKSLFGSTFINKVHDGYGYEDISVRHLPNAFSAVKFKIGKTVQGFLEAIQIDKRFFIANPTYKYPMLRLILARENASASYEILQSRATKNSKSNYIEINLSEGSYVLIVLADWDEEIHDLKVSFYGNTRINLERVNTKYHPDLLEKILSTEAIARGKQKPFSDKEKIKKFEIIDESGGLVIESFVNETTNSIIVKKQLKAIENLTLYYPITSTKKNDIADLPKHIELEIDPGSTRCFVYKKMYLPTPHILESTDSLMISPSKIRPF